MANMKHPKHIVHANNVYELVQPKEPAAPGVLIHKGARYVLALEKDPPGTGNIPSKPAPAAPAKQKARTFGPPSTQPGGKLDPALIDDVHVDKLQQEALDKMQGLQDAPVRSRRKNLRELLTDVDDPSILNSANYAYHNLPALSALLDLINNSGLVGFINNKTRDLTIKLKDSIINPDRASLEAMIEDPEAYPDEVEKLNRALHVMYNDIPNLVGASEVLVEAMRVLTNQLVQRGAVQPRAFKEVKTKYKKVLQDLAKFDPSSRESVQKKKPTKLPSGKPPRGRAQKNPLLQG